jgi:subfamily B ATP-binding cassette protein MsbA
MPISRLLKNPALRRLLKKVQMQGGARSEARGVLVRTAQRRASAPTPQMGLFQQPARSAGRLRRGPLMGRSRLLEGSMLAADLAVVAAAWLAACALRFAGTPIPLIHEAPPWGPYLVLLGGILAGWALAFKAFDLYRPRSLGSRWVEVWDIARACAAVTFVLVAFSFFLRAFEFSRLVFGYFWLLSTVALPLEREGFRRGLRALRRSAFHLRRPRWQASPRPPRSAEPQGPALASTLRRTLGYTQPYRGRLAAALICMAGSALLGTVSIAALQPVVDLFLVPKPGRGLTLPPAIGRLSARAMARAETLGGGDPMAIIGYICAGLLALVLVRGILQFAEEYLLVYVEEGIVRDVRSAAYAHLHRLSMPFFVHRSKGDLVVRLTSDAQLMGQAINVFFERGLGEVFVLGAAALVLLLLQWQLALGALLLLPLSFTVVARIGRRIFQRTARVQQGLAAFTARVQEALAGVRIVKAFCAEAYEEERARAQTQAVFRRSLQRGRADAVVSPILEVLAWTGSVALLWVGALFFSRQVLTPGQLVAFLAILGSMYQPVRRLGRVNAALQRGLSGAGRIFELLDEEPEALERPGASPLARPCDHIAFHSVSFGYDAGQPVLREVSFSAKVGEVVAIVGPTGAGKTTLVNLIPRLYDPTAGWIALDGRDIRTVTLRSLRRQIGLVTQESVLFDDTIAHNIAYGRGEAPRARIEEAAQIAGALEFIRRLPRGFDTPIGEGGALLSGGERQRLAIARAILADPAIVILDEATSALDAETERGIQDALERLMAHRTTFVIGHRLSTIMRSDKIVVLERGVVMEMGTHAELLARSGTYQRIYQDQMIHA